MTVSIKSTALRSAITTALETIDAKLARGSFAYDKETGEVKFEVQLASAAAPSTKPAVSDTGDEAKDKFLNIVARLELDKKVRRWYNRNIIDVNGGKWIITAISNKGDKFTLSPKDGEGRNKRVDFADIEAVIEQGRTGRIDLGTKPKGNTNPTAPSGKKDKDGEAVEAIAKLSADEVTELYNICLEKGLIEKAKRRNNKSRMEALVASDKLTGRGSVMTHLKKLSSDEPKADGKKDNGSLTDKQREMIESRLRKSYNADRKLFAKNVNSKFSRVKFLTEYTVKDQVRVIVGYLVEEEKVRVFDPASARFRKVDPKTVLRNISK